MPHVILKGDFTITDWADDFQPMEQKETHWLIKFNELYIERKGKRALVPVVTVEEGHPQTYYVRLSLNEGRRLSIRLDPSTDPIKTRGVKRSIALIAETLKHRFPHLEVESHNLEDYFEA